MNEEEKQAVEKMQYILDLINKNGEYTADEKDIKHIIVITNLIIKYQKEIEDMVRGKFINKDKIKEKIKELESHIWKDGYMTKFDKYAIHYLKELLGE